MKKQTLLLLAIPALFAAAQPLDRIVAVVEREPLTWSEVRDTYRRAGAPPNMLFQDALEEKITDVMINQEITRLGIKVSDVEIDQAVGDVMAQQRLDKRTLLQQLELAGMDYEAYRKSIGEQIRRIKVVNQRIRSNVSVSDTEAAEAYAKHSAETTAGAVADARVMLFPFPSDAATESARLEALAMRQQLLAGTDFGQAAKARGRGPNYEKGGLIEGVQRGELQKPLEEAIFNLKPGEISQPTLGKGAWFLVKLERLGKGSLASFEEMKPQLVDEIYQQKFEALFQKWVLDLRSKTSVKILETGNPGWD